MGLFDSATKDPQTMFLLSRALLGFGQAAAQAGAAPPPGRPAPSLLGGLSQGFAGGGSALQEALLMQQLMKDRELRTKQLQLQVAEQERKAEFMKKFPGMVREFQQGAPAVEAFPSGVANVDPLAGGGRAAVTGPRIPAQPARPAGNFGGLAAAIAQDSPAAAVTLLGQQATIKAKQAAAAAEESRFQRQENRLWTQFLTEERRQGRGADLNAAKTRADMFTKGLALRAAGRDVPSSIYGEDVSGALSDVTQKEAVTALRAGKSGGLQLEFDENGRVVGMSMGGPAGDTAARAQAKADVKTRTEIEDSKTAFVNLARRGQELVTKAQGSGASVLSLSGTINQIGDSIQAQAEAIAKQVGVSNRLADYDFTTLERNGVTTSQMKSALLDLAILKASAIGLGSGRALSDRDIQKQLETLGASAGSVPQFVGTLTETIRQVGLDIQTRARLRGGEQDFDIFGYAREAGIDPSYLQGAAGGAAAAPATGAPATAPGAPAGAPPQIRSDAEYNALPSGSVFVDPEGNVRRKP